ncbi:hypothetical protein KIPB_007157, partial [Kipferlia bialata]
AFHTVLGQIALGRLPPNSSPSASRCETRERSQLETTVRDIVSSTGTTGAIFNAETEACEAAGNQMRDNFQSYQDADICHIANERERADDSMERATDQGP